MYASVCDCLFGSEPLTFLPPSPFSTSGWSRIDAFRGSELPPSSPFFATLLFISFHHLICSLLDIVSNMDLNIVGIVLNEDLDRGLTFNDVLNHITDVKIDIVGWRMVKPGVVEVYRGSGLNRGTVAFHICSRCAFERTSALIHLPLWREHCLGGR